MGTTTTTTNWRKPRLSVYVFVLFSLATYIGFVIEAPFAFAVPSSSQSSTDSQFTGFEGLFDPPNTELLLRIPQISSDGAAMRTLSELVVRYERLNAAASTSPSATVMPQARELGVAKVRFYARVGLTKRIMSIRPEDVGGYLSKWRAYWAQEDRIAAARAASAFPVQGTRVSSQAMKLSSRLSQMLALGVESEAFDRALLANRDYLGPSPDDERIALVEDSGCKEYYHQDDVVGGGYAIDTRNVLFADRCLSSEVIQVYSCPPQPKVEATPTPGTTQQSVTATARRIPCRCEAMLATDKTETAKCIGR